MIDTTIPSGKKNKDVSYEICENEDKGNVVVTRAYIGTKKKYVTLKIKFKENEIENRCIVQSYILSSARYDFSTDEQRILYRIISCFQYLMNGQKLDENFKIDPEFSCDVIITFPLKATIIQDKNDDENYYLLKTALLNLLSNKIEYLHNNRWMKIPSVIVLPKVDKDNNVISFRLHEKLYSALLNFSKGFRKYKLETMMNLSDVYTMRLYALVSKQKKQLTYKIKDLKYMFGLEDKYHIEKDFIINVIDPAKKELDLKAPYSFDYILKEEKELTKIILKPTYNSKNEDKKLVNKRWTLFKNGKK
jgi:hypothetical protein